MPRTRAREPGACFSQATIGRSKAQLKRDLISVLEKLQGYCNENTYFIRSAEGKLIRKVKPVTDIEAFMEIRRVFDSGRML